MVNPVFSFTRDGSSRVLSQAELPRRSCTKQRQISLDNLSLLLGQSLSEGGNDSVEFSKKMGSLKYSAELPLFLRRIDPDFRSQLSEGF